MADSQACLDILTGAVANPVPTNFDNNNGKMYIIESQGCWDAVLADVNNQIATAEEGLATIAQLGFPIDVVEQAIEDIRGTTDYSSGKMVFAQWQWDQNDLSSGDQVGFCYYQPSQTAAENHSSCFAYTFEGGQYDAGRSYLIKPSQIGKNSTLANFTPIDDALPRGTAGSWILSTPFTAFDSTKIAFGMRFSPNVSSSSDPAVRIGATEAVTYMTSRPSVITQTETSELFASEKMRLMQGVDSFASNKLWVSQSVNLACYNDKTCFVPGGDGDGNGSGSGNGGDGSVGSGGDGGNTGGGTGAMAVSMSMATAIAAVATLLAF